MTEQHNITISLDKEDFEALEATGYDIPMNVTRFLRDEAQTRKRKLAQQKKDDIKNVISACLGGGAWVFYGELMSGEYFMTDNYGDIIVLDESPKDFDKSLYNSWQEKHFIRWIEGDARNTFLRSMLDRITKNLPDDDDGGITERELEQIKQKMGVLTEEKMSKEYEEAKKRVQEDFAYYGNGHSEYMVVDVDADKFLDWATRMSLDENFREPIAGVHFEQGDDGSTVAFFSACEKYTLMLCPIVKKAFPNARVYGFCDWDGCCFVAPPKAYKTSLAECFSDGENLRLDVRITDKKSGCGSSIGDLICFDSSEEIDDVDEDDTYSFLVGLLNKNEKKKVDKVLNECRDFLIAYEEAER